MLTDRVTGAAIHPDAPFAAERGIPYPPMEVILGLDSPAFLSGNDPDAVANQFTMFGSIREMRRALLPLEWRAAFARRVLDLDDIGCFLAEAQRIAGLPVTAPAVEVLYQGEDVTVFADGTAAIDQAPSWYYGDGADAPTAMYFAVGMDAPVQDWGWQVDGTRAVYLLGGYDNLRRPDGSIDGTEDQRRSHLGYAPGSRGVGFYPT